MPQSRNRHPKQDQHGIRAVKKLQQREEEIAGAELNPPQPPQSQSGVHHLLTVTELARYLNVDKFTVYRLIANDRLPAFKVGSQWRIKPELLEKWLDAKLSIRKL